MKATIHKATVDRAAFLKAARFADMATGRRTSIPILTTVRLDFQDGGLVVTGTDLDMMCRYRIDAAYGGPFSFCLDASFLIGLLLAADGRAVDLTYIDGPAERTCTIRSGDMQATVRTLFPAEDFPILDMAPAAAVTLGADVLRRALDDTLPAVSTEETRYYLNGVYLHSKDDGDMRAVATDGRRLVLRAHPGVPFPQDLNAILPTKLARILCVALQEAGNEGCTVSADGLKRRFDTDSGTWSVTSKVIDGTYPDYTRVIPTDVAGIEFPVSLGMIRRAASVPQRRFTRFSGSRSIRFDVDAGTYSVTAHDLGEVAFALTGGRGQGSISFNIKYLRSFLSRNRTALVRSRSGNDPALLVTEDPNLVQVVMPMRV